MRYFFLFVKVAICFVVMNCFGKLLVIGHRGAAGHEPENTLLSFQKAIKFGVDVVECDVWCCASGEMVVFHDNKIDRLTNSTGYIKQKTLQELKKLTLEKNQQILTLEEVIDFIDHRVVINIELKDADAVMSVTRIIKNYVQKGWSYADFIVTSFNHHAIRDFNQQCPSVPVGVILAGTPVDYAACAERAHADVIVLYINSVNQAFVDDAHARGMRVFVFTVNDSAAIQRMKNLMVDGIISDYPDRVMCN